MEELDKPSIQPVEVTNADPLPVEVRNDEPLRVRTEQDKVAATRGTSAEKALAGAKVDADTRRREASVQADILRTDDQRRISGIWERTQQVIALLVVLTTVAVASFKATFDALQDATRGVAAGPAFLFLVAASNLVIGFYFGRTNHQRVGGSTSYEEQDAGR